MQAVPAQLMSITNCKFAHYVPSGDVAENCDMHHDARPVGRLVGWWLVGWLVGWLVVGGWWLAVGRWSLVVGSWWFWVLLFVACP